MSVASSFAERYQREARLIILRGLAEEIDGALSAKLMSAKLETFGINRSLDWIGEEYRKLADLGAVTVTEAGSVVIARITPKGRDHLALKVRIGGVDQPTEPVT
ncbi:VpaChn25_0724 family phage protein [Prosthecodimorpha staleyi]|uniref:Uncharacterized protein n=1 Tax=Prosthecodimorpha staleyi TaxID=2840188 RepID=A0A947DC82_9HYPH|nr:hypothetical protein [Prosthecodimorpha staleyi]MBT9293317.1 hypothetical protein [Prosthecodimorpha staleyi]